MNRHSKLKTMMTLLIMMFGLLYLMWRFRKQVYALYLKMQKLHTEVQDFAGQIQAQMPAIEGVKESLMEIKMPKLPSKRISAKLSPRQHKIVELLKSGGEVEMKLLSREVGGVSQRTLRRDMNYLEKEGVIIRLGKTKDTIYKLA